MKIPTRFISRRLASGGRKEVVRRVQKLPANLGRFLQSDCPTVVWEELWEAAGRRSVVQKYNQSLIAYCFEKITRVNRLSRRPRKKIVEYIVHGIHDEQIRITATNKETVPELTRCLESFSVKLSRNSREIKDRNK